MGKTFPSIGIMFGGLSAIVFIFLILQGSFLVKEGRIEEATTIGFAAVALISFVYGGALVILFSSAFPKLFPPLFEEENISLNVRDFSLGFLAFFLIGILSGEFAIFKFAVLDVSTSIFAQASQSLSPFFGYFLVVLGAPFAEEATFFIALPGILYAFMIGLSKVEQLSFLKNGLLQTIIVILVVAPVFAAFHIGQQGLVNFFIAAVIFRGILLFLSYDLFEDFVPSITTGFLFALGGHIANNIQATGGIVVFFTTMLSGTTLVEQIFGILPIVTILSIFGLFIFNLLRGEYF